MTEFFTLAWLGTAAGIVAAVALLTQVTKFFIKAAIDPKIYCLIWSFVFSLAVALWVTPAATAADWFSAVINMFLIASAASGTFEYAIKPLQRAVLAKTQDSDNIGDTEAKV
jgi:hypothetical protein